MESSSKTALEFEFNRSLRERDWVRLGGDEFARLRWENLAGSGSHAAADAIASGEWGIVLLWMARGCCMPDSALHSAALSAQASTVEALLKAGADPDGRKIAGASPLALACMRDDGLGIAETLLLFGCDPEHGGSEGSRKPLDLAFEKGSPFVLLLLAAGASPEGDQDGSFDPDLALSLAAWEEGSRACVAAALAAARGQRLRHGIECEELRRQLAESKRREVELLKTLESERFGGQIDESRAWENLGKAAASNERLIGLLSAGSRLPDSPLRR